MRIVGYCYDADYSCVQCTPSQLKPEGTVDREGNFVRPLYAIDTDGSEVCHICHEVLCPSIPPDLWELDNIVAIKLSSYLSEKVNSIVDPEYTGSFLYYKLLKIIQPYLKTQVDGTHRNIYGNSMLNFIVGKNFGISLTINDEEIFNLDEFIQYCLNKFVPITEMLKFYIKYTTMGDEYDFSDPVGLFKDFINVYANTPTLYFSIKDHMEDLMEKSMINVSIVDESRVKIQNQIDSAINTFMNTISGIRGLLND